MTAPLVTPSGKARIARRSAARTIALVLAVSPSLADAKRGAFRDSPHGRQDTGVQRVPGQPRGACAHCHGAPRQGNARRSEGNGHSQQIALRENELCLGCHSTPSGTWLGNRQYGESAHASSPSVVWPGPAPRGRDAADSGKCVNCHDPHGVKDASGVIPDLLVVRGAALCVACHTGNPGPDVVSAFAKTYRHPLIGDPAGGDAVPPVATRARAMASLSADARTATCAACHNPHAGAREGVAPRAPDGSRALAGVAHARLSTAGRGSPRVQSLVSPADSAFVREHEICFKCHSGSAAAGARASDIAAAVNPANASFHPIEAQGKNPGIDGRAFAPGWRADRLVVCSDCHSSDDDASRGPHGSDYPHILRRRYPAGSRDQQVRETDLCFTCHAYGTYGDAMAGEAASFSRFPGHRSHAAKGLSCWACHVAHGSTNLPALIAQRSPGIVVYAQEGGGGSCTVSCHATAPANVTYQAPYRR